MTTPAVDFVEELRLRSWARENYVPADERDTEWHAIVHDEMDRRDRELGRDGGCHARRAVPLMPGGRTVDAAHALNGPRETRIHASSTEMHYH